MQAIDNTPEGVTEPRIGRSVSLDHAAQLLGVSRRTIYNRIRDGRLQTIRTPGGSQRVLLDSVQIVRSQAAERTARSSYYSRGKPQSPPPIESLMSKHL